VADYRRHRLLCSLLVALAAVAGCARPPAAGSPGPPRWSPGPPRPGADRFARHPAVQPATVRVVDRDHPATARLPAVWARTDEWYEFRGNPRGRVRVLATLDESTYRGGGMGADHPIAWCHGVGRGR
jgi:hypothetical protein